ncbi:unnamed protein product [Allacma fusca]|uniref:peptidylglycine monooxygenase n=1 Tax=Allacma fusca TaxID=39272 RepID=A0A8J2LQC8_9HEXA|nr:unnamed protein product [Allacma fusca]
MFPSVARHFFMINCNLCPQYCSPCCENVICAVFCALSGADPPPTDSFPIFMPHVKPEKAETYLCTSVRVSAKQDYYIVGFTPNATMNVAHHMLLYGCSKPGSTEDVWNCGGMSDGGLPRAGICNGGSKIIYAWARNAPQLDLPKGVAFRVGGSTDTQYVVLQVHYADVSSFTNGTTDDSGIEVHYTETPQPKSASVFLLGTGGYIPPNSTEHMETACIIYTNKDLHPFAYRTHTHALGHVVSGYRVRRNYKTGKDQWTLIGKKNPMLPQMFYPVEKALTVSDGDILAARCTMVSNRNRTTAIGATAADEMCNFYMMYWVDADGPSLTLKPPGVSFTSGPPYYYWGKGKPTLNNIPHKDASSL